MRAVERCTPGPLPGARSRTISQIIPLKCSEPGRPAALTFFGDGLGRDVVSVAGYPGVATVEVLRDVADKRSDRRKFLKNVRGGTIIRLLEGAPLRSPREDARGIPERL